MADPILPSALRVGLCCLRYGAGQLIRKLNGETSMKEYGGLIADQRSPMDDRQKTYCRDRQNK
jgi:hypothetical protein